MFTIGLQYRRGDPPQQNGMIFELAQYEQESHLPGFRVPAADAVAYALKNASIESIQPATIRELEHPTLNSVRRNPKPSLSSFCLLVSSFPYPPSSPTGTTSATSSCPKSKPQKPRPRPKFFARPLAFLGARSVRAIIYLTRK